MIDVRICKHGISNVPARHGILVAVFRDRKPYWRSIRILVIRIAKLYNIHVAVYIKCLEIVISSVYCCKILLLVCLVEDPERISGAVLLRTLPQNRTILGKHRIRKTIELA